TVTGDAAANTVYHYELIYVLVSSTPVNKTTEALFQENLDRAEITYSALGSRALKGLRRTSGTAPLKLTNYYCIAPRFVNRYWRFSENSLIYIDTCHSASDYARSFVDACATSGAASYAGWTKSVQDKASAQTTQVFFDALLGQS